MKKDKSKKDKIKQGNLRDFDLLYDTLLSGGTYSDYRSELLDRSMPQEMPLEITEDDILAAWILGKDEESELYARGGHIHQGLKSDLYREQFGGTYSNPNFGSANASSLTTNGTTSNANQTTAADYIQGAQKTLGFIQMFDTAGSNIFDMLNKKSMNDPTYKYIYGDSSKGWWERNLYANNDFLQGLYQLRQGVLNVGTGDTASLYEQYKSIQPALRSNVDTDRASLSGWLIDPTHILLDDVYDERKNTWNQVAENVDRQNLSNFDTAVTNSNKLNLWNQMSQPYMAACGGKMKNRLASGGYINSHYDYITDPLVKVNAGGTHQENPNEGVLTSIAPDGQPNLVEEGETIINNGQEDAYVFSDRIVADDEILKSHLLPNKFAGKTYADISKELDKIIEEHKNDEISKRTFDEMISRLLQAQEDQKYQEEAEEVAKFIDGLSDEEKEQLEQTMVEEAQAEQQAAEEQAIAEQQAQELAVREQLIQPEQTPEQAVMEQPVEQVVPSRYDQMMSRALFADAANQGLFGRGGHMHQDWNSLLNIGGYNPDYEGALIYPDRRTWVERNIFSPINTYFGNLSQRSPEFVSALTTLTPVGLVTDVANGDTENAMINIGLFRFGRGAKAAEEAAKIERSMKRGRKTMQESSLTRKQAQHNAKVRKAHEFDDLYEEAGIIEKKKQPNISYEDAEKILGPSVTKTEKGLAISKKGDDIAKAADVPQGMTRGQKALAVGIPASMFGTLGIGAYITGNNNNGDDVSKYVYEPVNSSELEQRQLITNQAYEDSIFREYMKAHKHQDGYYAYMSPGYTRAPFFYDIYKVNTTNNNNIPSLSANQLIQQQFVSQPNDVAPVAYRPVRIEDDVDQQVISSDSPSVGVKKKPKKKTVVANSHNTLLANPYAINVDYPKATADDEFGYGKYGWGWYPKNEYHVLNEEDYVEPVYTFDNTSQGLASTNVSDEVINEFNKGANPVTTDSVEEPEDPKDTNIDNYSWLRYAPAIGSGIRYLSDLFGVTNRNDYTNPNMVQRYINQIPNVGFVPLRGYKRYNPFDETYQQNVLRSMQESTRRAIVNNSNGNLGAALAALDTLNYQGAGLFGDLALKAREYNDKQQLAVDEYNNNINRINASLSMTAQEKNLAIAAQKAMLEYRIANMRQEIEDTNDAAKSANETNFYLNLGAIGKENFNMEMVRSNPAFYYTILSNGEIVYKNGFDDLPKKQKKIVEENAKKDSEALKKIYEQELKDKENRTMNPERTNNYLYGLYGVPYGLGFGYRGFN